MNIIPVIHYGLGPIGQSIGRAVAAQNRLISVGAVDVNLAIAGRQLAELCDSNLPPLIVVNSLAELSCEAGAVVLQATVSTLAEARPQLLEAIARGYHVVSTCEELIWPWHDYPAFAKELDASARRSGVAILATGVNPGFVMDTLPLLLSRATDKIEAIHISRIVDLNDRRRQLQRKMGVGQYPDRVQALLEEERIGHIGLATSLHMLAAGLGWQLDVIDLDNRPIVAKDATETGLGKVPAGAVIGVRQQALGMVGGMPRIILNLVMEADTEGGTRDEILIDGEQCMRLRLDGLQGDLATSALVANYSLSVRNLKPGLHTVLSAPLEPKIQ